MQYLNVVVFIAFSAYKPVVTFSYVTFVIALLLITSNSYFGNSEWKARFIKVMD